METGSGRGAVWVAFAANALIFFVKAISAWISGSAVMFSEALHSLADLFNSIFLLIGLKLSLRPADDEHPFGYGKEVYFWSFVASIFMLGVTSMGSLFRGYNQIIRPHPIEDYTISLIALLLSIIFEGYAVYYAMNGVLRDVGLRLKGLKRISQSFKVISHVTNPAVKLVFFEDFVAFSGVVLALGAILLVRMTGNLVIDGLISMVIGTILAVLAVLLAVENRELIIGRAAVEAVEQRIGDIALTVPEVKDIHSLKTMYVGPRAILVNMEIEVTPQLTVDRVDDIVAEVEKRIRVAVPKIQYCTIEILADDRRKNWIH